MNFYKRPGIILTITAAAGAAAIDAAVIAAVGTPDYILINLGTNDLAGIDGGSITDGQRGRLIMLISLTLCTPNGHRQRFIVCAPGI